MGHYSPWDPSYPEVANTNFAITLCYIGGQLWLGAPNTSLYNSPMKYANSTLSKP